MKIGKSALQIVPSAVTFLVKAMHRNLDIRPSPIAGQWYPADAHELSVQIDRFLDAAVLPEMEGEVVGVMAPHAGYYYSGAVAGFAFAAIRGRSPEIVVVVSPMHYPYFEQVLTTAHSAYATPLGAIPVDVAILEELDDILYEEARVRIGRVTFDSEHSLEIELPFLQRALANPFRLVPLMLREQSDYLARAVGNALARTISAKDCLLVASSDLSHFYPQKTAKKLDAEMLHQVEAFDPAGVLRVEEEGKGFACGRAAVAAVMWAAKDLGARKVKLLHHATSGDVSGDYGRVVGYGAAAFLR